MWPSAGKELSPWLFTCAIFIFGAVLVVRVPFQFGVLGRVLNLFVSVPDHCLFMYLIEGKSSLFVAMCIFIVFLFKEGVIYKYLYPPSLTRICLSAHSFRIPSAGYFPDYQCTG